MVKSIGKCTYAANVPGGQYAMATGEKNWASGSRSVRLKNNILEFGVKLFFLAMPKGAAKLLWRLFKAGVLARKTHDLYNIQYSSDCMMVLLYNNCMHVATIIKIVDATAGPSS